MDSKTDVFREKGILTVYELYFAEILKKLFRQFRSEARNTYLPETLESNSTDTRGKTKRLLPSDLQWNINQEKVTCQWITKNIQLPY